MATFDPELRLSPEEIDARRAHPEPDSQVIFRLAGLYGICREGIEVPLNNTESIDSGPVTLMLDPDSPEGSNFGIVDFERKKLRVRYNVQLVFPGLYDLVTSGRHDPNLLHPIRATATDDCQVTDDYSGWRALGRMDFLPGSLWSGAGGG
ncbi:MAG TPA: hypothetical protein VK756_01660 [Solirubrobacteraceae bacterium]|jgi:hypothetical protein|nr:hypothetical protein [Solirubrobacteraceae bacterium]